MIIFIFFHVGTRCGILWHVYFFLAEQNVVNRRNLKPNYVFKKWPNGLVKLKFDMRIWSYVVTLTGTLNWREVLPLSKILIYVINEEGLISVFACTLEVISCWCLSDRQLRVKHRLWGLRIAPLAEVYTNNVALHQHFSNSLTDVDSFRLLAVRIVWE